MDKTSKIILGVILGLIVAGLIVLGVLYESRVDMVIAAVIGLVATVKALFTDKPGSGVTPEDTDV